MRKIEADTFDFKELTDKAKERAKQQHAEVFGYSWGDEAIVSLRKLAEHFDCTLKNYRIDWFASSYSSAEFETPDEPMTVPEIRRRLKVLGDYDKETTRGLGKCKLTGFSVDEDAIDGFRISFLSGATDLQSLLQAAFKSWLKASQADCEDQYTDETFAEMCEANSYEFYDNGELV